MRQRSSARRRSARAAIANGLWQALIDGEIDLIATDHSPAPPALKSIDDGDFLRAWGGIASLQLGLPAVWTAARSARHRYRATRAMDVVRAGAARGLDAYEGPHRRRLRRGSRHLGSRRAI